MGMADLFFIILILGATVWSAFHYINNAKAINEGYLRAKTLVTPLGNDHVRFSWLVSVAVLLSGFLCITKERELLFGYW